MIKIIDGLNGYQFIDVSIENINESISYICADSSMRSLYLSSKNQNEGLIERICVHPDRIKIRHLHIMCEIENVQLFESFDWLEEINFGVENTKFDFSKMKNLKVLGGIWSKFWKGMEHCLFLESIHVSRFSNHVAAIPNLTKLKKIVLIQPNLSSLDGIESARSLIDLELTMAKKLENIDALNSCAPTLLKLKLDGCRKIRSYDAIEKLVNLSYLILSGSADLISISFIEKMPKLVTLSIYGTKLLDNNLTYCISHPCLIDFRSENKRTYIPTVPEVEGKLILKTKNSDFEEPAKNSV